MTAEGQPSHLHSSLQGGGERKAGLLSLLITHWPEPTSQGGRCCVSSRAPCEDWRALLPQEEAWKKGYGASVASIIDTNRQVVHGDDRQPHQHSGDHRGTAAFPPVGDCVGPGPCPLSPSQPAPCPAVRLGGDADHPASTVFLRLLGWWAPTRLQPAGGSGGTRAGGEGTCAPVWVPPPPKLLWFLPPLQPPSPPPASSSDRPTPTP